MPAMLRKVKLHMSLLVAHQQTCITSSKSFVGVPAPVSARRSVMPDSNRCPSSSMALWPAAQSEHSDVRRETPSFLL